MCQKPVRPKSLKRPIASFEELARYFPAMDLELEKIDQYLEDERLYRWIKADLSSVSE